MTPPTNMPENQCREELINKLRSISVLTLNEAGIISDFILEDRKRIVDPLVIYHNCYPSHASMKAIDQTLKNAGVEV